MVFVKEAYPRDKYEASFQELWKSMWQQGNDLSRPDVMAETLSRHFGPEEVKRIIDAANSPAYKLKLNENTKRALDKGAFGCP